MGPSPRPRTQSARVSGSDGATKQGCLFTFAFRSYRGVRACWRGKLMGPIFRLSRSGAGTVPVGSHSRRECRGAMVRRGKLYAYLGYPVIPGVRACWRGKLMGPILRLSRTAMGPRSSLLENLEENANCRGFSSKDYFGGLPVNDEHVPHPCMHAAVWNSSNESRPLASHHGRPWMRRFGTRHDG